MFGLEYYSRYLTQLNYSGIKQFPLKCVLLQEYLKTKWMSVRSYYYVFRN